MCWIILVKKCGFVSSFPAPPPLFFGNWGVGWGYANFFPMTVYLNIILSRTGDNNWHCSNPSLPTARPWRHRDVIGIFCGSEIRNLVSLCPMAPPCCILQFFFSFGFLSCNTTISCNMCLEVRVCLFLWVDRLVNYTFGIVS